MSAARNVDREYYVTTSELIVQAMEAGIAYEETELPVHLATERGLRAEITRRHELDWCDDCGYPGADCLCVGTAKGRTVLLLNEFEANCKGAA